MSSSWKWLFHSHLSTTEVLLFEPHTVHYGIWKVQSWFHVKLLGCPHLLVLCCSHQVTKTEITFWTQCNCSAYLKCFTYTIFSTFFKMLLAACNCHTNTCSVVFRLRYYKIRSPCPICVITKRYSLLIHHIKPKHLLWYLVQEELEGSPQECRLLPA